MIEITFAVVLDSPDDCNNAGHACFTCPHFDQCDNHYDGEEQ